MSKYINVSDITIVNRTASSCTYRYTVSRANSSYFGIADDGSGERCLVIGRPGAYKYYWAYPDNYSGLWWYYRVAQGYTHYNSSRFGYLPITNNTSVTVEETVNISKGNSRQGSVTIQYGVTAGYNVGDRSYWQELRTATLTTTETPRPSNAAINVRIDDPTVRNRKIKVSGSFTNPDNYYRAEVYNKDGKLILSTGNNTFSIEIPVDKSIFNTSQVYTLKIIGKDKAVYSTISTNPKACFVEPDGVGMSVKLNSDIREIDSAYLKNVSNKTIIEVWVKINGKIVKTVK